MYLHRSGVVTKFRSKRAKIVRWIWNDEVRGYRRYRSSCVHRDVQDVRYLFWLSLTDGSRDTLFAIRYDNDDRLTLSLSTLIDWSLVSLQLSKSFSYYVRLDMLSEPRIYEDDFEYQVRCVTEEEGVPQGFSRIRVVTSEPEKWADLTDGDGYLRR